MDGEEIGLLLRQERGQFLEFLSAYDYKKNAAPKAGEDLAREIARLVGGMANADGGTLLVGVELDKAVTGIPHSPNELQELIRAPGALLTPPLAPACGRAQLGNLVLLKFEITSSPEVHRIAGGRAFYRITTENPALPPEQIQNLRDSKRNVFYERQNVLDATVDDLDLEAAASLAEKIGDPRDPVSVLQRVYHLVDHSRDRTAVTMAALLLFAKEPTRWHPRAGVDFVKYEGTERRHGASLNVVKRIRFEAPLCRLVDETVGRVKEHIRERTLLHDLFFRERLEYPVFAWQEALVNAVGHRDYSLTGAPIEVWMFDDRIEVRSPGLPPSPVTIEQLRQQQRVHFSRNPLLVRTLADLGYMRDMGEGIPRIFQEMEHHGLQPPEFSTEGFIFTATLRNTPIYDETTLRWLSQFGATSVRQRRLLAYAYAHGKSFSTTDYQRVGEVDRDTAYREIRLMVKQGIVAPLKPKSRSYKIIEKL
jgi:ATP-dependent DNA helicase RecG